MKTQINRICTVFFLVFLICSCKTGQKDLDQVRFLIDSIQSQAIPDKRLEIFDIRASLATQGVILRGESTNAAALAILLEKINQEEIRYLDSIRILPDKALGDKFFGLITLSVANLRYKPAHEAEMATQALMGTPVRILKEENNWLLVQTPDQYISWTLSGGLTRLTSGELDSWNNQPRIMITEDYGLIFSKPDTESQPVSDLVMGCILATDPLLPVKPGYTGVHLADGRNGYIESFKGIDFDAWIQLTHPTTAGIISLTKGFLGRPYLWGGTSAKGFDCSGFTKTVFFMQGIILNRDASQQVREGSGVPLRDCWEKLRTGDLLFFGRKASGEQTERVSHVGLYLGNSEFIHAASGNAMVKINTLDSTRSDFNPYYLQNLLHITRFDNPETNPVPIAKHNWYK